MDFNECEVVRLLTYERKYVAYRLLIKEVKKNAIKDSDIEPFSYYYLDYEHVMVPKSDGINANIKINIPSCHKRVPTCILSDDLLYRVEIEEI